MQNHGELVADEEVFAKGPRTTLADVLDRIEATYAGTALRDARSAFRFLSDRAGVDPAEIRATPAKLRGIFDGLSAGRLGISPKRLANIRSIVTRAVERFGDRRIRTTQKIRLSEDWHALLASCLRREDRWALGRLACYCTVKGIAPEAVTCETLRGLRTALEAEAVSKCPKALLKQTIHAWNRCHREVAGWPDIRLSSPDKKDPYMLPLEAFPQSFQQAVAEWEARMSTPDPLDLAAPVRALRPDTLQGYRYTFRRLATALVRSGTVTIEQVTGFGIFFTVDHFKAALRPFLKGKNGIQTDGYAHKMAVQMLNVGRHSLRHDEAVLAPFVQIAERLRAREGRQMGRRNRERLGQLDDAEVVGRLLCFPEEELARALRTTSPIRRAKGVERALAISLAIFTGLRIKNLRQLRLDQNIRRSGKRVFVQIGEDEAKTHADLELELPEETIRLLDLFLAEHRALLPGSDGPYLFPGISGGARSYSAMRDALCKPLRRHAGIDLSPHLYRHAIAKIVIELHPELAFDVSRRLGHKSVNTTYQSYLGTEGPAASRRISALLGDLRDDPGRGRG